MEHNLKITSLAAIFLFSVSCTGNKINNFQLYESPIGFQMEVPLGFKYSELAPSKKYYYFGYPKGNHTGLSTIEFYNSLDFSKLNDFSNCSAEILGVSFPLTLNNKNTLWGKMDFYKDRGMEGWEPSSDESLLVCHGGGMNPPESVYAFCSEHDDKTVVICISQMTDNEAQAKEIFETFRWTE